MIVASLYVGIEIRLISGLPFSGPFNESRVTINSQTQLCWIGVILLPAVIQWALFRLWWVALMAGIVLVVVTWFILRLSFGALDEEFRWRLHILKMGSAQMFKEIE